MKNIAILFFLLFSFSLSAQFRMIGSVSGSWTTLNDSTHQATITFQSDLTGQGYLATQIVDSFLVFTPTEQTYRIDSVWNKTFSSVTLRVVERLTTTNSPIGQILVYNPDGRNTIPNIPFGSTGATAQLNAAIDAWNARQISESSAGNYKFVTIDSFATFTPNTPTPSVGDFVLDGRRGSTWRKSGSSTYARVSLDNGNNVSSFYFINNDTLDFNSNLYNHVRLITGNVSSAHINAPANIGSQFIGETFLIGISSGTSNVTVTWDTLYGKFDFTNMPNTTVPANSILNYTFRVVSEGGEGIRLQWIDGGQNGYGIDSTFVENDSVKLALSDGREFFTGLADTNGAAIPNGEIAFGNSAGNGLTSDSDLKWNETSNILTIKNSTADNPFVGIGTPYINAKGTSQPLFFGVGDFGIGSYLYHTSNYPTFQFQKARGSFSSPAPIVAGDFIGGLVWQGRGSGNTFPGGEFNMKAAGETSSGYVYGDIELYLRPSSFNGSTIAFTPGNLAWKIASNKEVTAPGYPNTRNDYATLVPTNILYTNASGLHLSTKPDSIQVTNPVTNIGLVTLRTALRILFNTKQKVIQYKDEGSNLGTAGTVTSIDFVGAGVTATRVSDEVTVTISPVSSSKSGTYTPTVTAAIPAVIDTVQEVIQHNYTVLDSFVTVYGKLRISISPANAGLISEFRITQPPGYVRAFDNAHKQVYSQVQIYNDVSAGGIEANATMPQTYGFINLGSPDRLCVAVMNRTVAPTVNDYIVDYYFRYHL